MNIPDPRAVFSGQISLAEVLQDVDYKEFPEVVNQLYAEITTIISGVNDTGATFVAHDPAQTDPAESGWTLGHVIVHLTAGLEELSVTAALLAGGIIPENRLRNEVPWETIQTAAQVQHRLAESRRMCQAFLNGWPDEPHFETTVNRIPQLGPMNCNAMFMLSLMHTKSHLEQIREIMRQAKAR